MSNDDGAWKLCCPLLVCPWETGPRAGQQSPAFCPVCSLDPKEAPALRPHLRWKEVHGQVDILMWKCSVGQRDAELGLLKVESNPISENSAKS